MFSPWLQDIESLEAISQNDEARQIFLRMAAMTRTGQLPSFLSELADDEWRLPTITGRAWLTGIGQYLLDPADPFPAGFRL